MNHLVAFADDSTGTIDNQTETILMKITEKYQASLLFATDLHNQQIRKGSGIPYLSHLLSVSALVMEHGGTEDEAIAALLHDAIEDQGDPYPGGRTALRLEIESRFGAAVLNIVNGCTDDDEFKKPAADGLGTVAEWKVRKSAYMEHIRQESNPSILRVSCADKLHNARSLLSDYRILGEELWGRFRAQTKQNHHWYYGGLAQTFMHHPVFQSDVGIRRLAQELNRVVVELFEFSS